MPLASRTTKAGAAPQTAKPRPSLTLKQLEAINVDSHCHLDFPDVAGELDDVVARARAEDMARILEEETGKGTFPAVLHCFTGGRDLARRAIAIGLFVSFTGIVTFKKSDELRAIAQSLPAERILLETDAPYLAPGRHRGKRNEPAYIVETATVVAEALGISLDAIARQTSENFFRLFRKVPPQTAGVDELKHPARA